jgi:hypothetical protein
LRSVIGDSSSGTGDDAATANDSGTLARSEQISAELLGRELERSCQRQSVAETPAPGALARCLRCGRGGNVLPRYSSSSRCARTWLRPYHGDCMR